MQKQFTTRLLLALSPVVKFIGKYIRFPYLIKKVNGLDYYRQRDNIRSGDILMTKLDGMAVNLLNPSPINHSGIYFGKGLLTAVVERIDQLKDDMSKLPISTLRTEINSKIERLYKIINDYSISDDIYYIFEASAEHGVVPTDLVTFMLTKDKVVGVRPLFCNAKIAKKASYNAIDSLGLPYDYGFSDEDDMKYCFEVCADAYKSVCDVELKRHQYRLLWFKPVWVYLSDTFTDTKLWVEMFDTDK